MERVGFNDGNLFAGVGMQMPAPAQTRPMPALQAAGGVVGTTAARLLTEKATGAAPRVPKPPAMARPAVLPPAAAVVGPGTESLYKLVRDPAPAAPRRSSSMSDSDSAFAKALPIVMLVLGFLGAAACSMSIYAYKDLTTSRKPDRNTKTILYVQIALLVLFTGFIIASLAVCVAPTSKLAFVV